MTAPFWWNWPSWRVELVAGILLQGFLRLWGPGHAFWLYWIVAMAISVMYELWLDRHGWSLKDVLQRVPGQALVEVAALIWSLARPW